jgi:hypothetical protein
VVLDEFAKIQTNDFSVVALHRSRKINTLYDAVNYPQPRYQSSVLAVSTVELCACARKPSVRQRT